MLTQDHLNLFKLERELSDIARGGFTRAADVFRQRLDAAKPSEDIRTHDVAVRYRLIKTDGGGETRYSHALTPHLEEIHDAFDDPNIRVIAVKGPARGGKTISAENYLLKVGMYGPSRNVLWYMHSEPDVKRYVKERVNWFLRNHEEVRAKLASVKNPAWNFKEVEGALWEWLAANRSTTRARSGSLAVADEIDAMVPDIRDSIVELLQNRQREFGNLGKVFVASHPDAGPQFGIDEVLRQSDLRLRIWACLVCGFLVGPSQETPAGRRIVWNVPALLKGSEEMPRDELVEMIREKTRLICPHCGFAFTNEDRHEMRVAARWFGKGEKIDGNERIVGDRVKLDRAGFVIHAFDAPFDTIGDMAKQWAEAKIESDTTGRRAKLKEVHVKTLGETDTEDSAGARPRTAQAIRARNVDDSYMMGQIPSQVDFLTAMIDVQVDRFEVGVIGWSRGRESWLIDRFGLAMRQGLETVRPAERLADWDALIPAVFNQTYALQDDPTMHMIIGKIAIDTGGMPGVTNNARIWTANSLAARKFQAWRVSLQEGSSSDKSELYGKPRPIKVDDAGRPLATPITERAPNVIEIKHIIANRMELATPGSGFMHLPINVEERHIRELASETFIAGLWVPRGRNETWDIWVGCEVCRDLLAPDSNTVDWVNRPIWAKPFPLQSKADKRTAETDFYTRFRRLNDRGDRGR